MLLSRRLQNKIQSLQKFIWQTLIIINSLNNSKKVSVSRLQLLASNTLLLLLFQQMRALIKYIQRIHLQFFYNFLYHFYFPLYLIILYYTPMNIPQDHTKVQAQIQAIKNTRFISQQQKVQRVNVLRSSQLAGTDSSSKTILSLTNTMIGSAVIVYPVLFLKDGIIGSSLIMLVVGCIQYATCRLLVIHNRTNEATFNQSILRIGGVTVNQFNSLINMLLLFFVCIAYYLLVANNFYQITASVVKLIKDFEIPKEITFEVYSIQWGCIISSIICIGTLFKKDIQPILKLIKYSIYCVIFYGIFVLINLIRLLIEGTIHFREIKLFDHDFSSVAGAFALSFLIHPTAAPILKKSANLKNNQRDLFFGYILTAIVYFYVGFIGGLTCAPKALDIQENPNDYSTIFDCFHDLDTTQQKVFYVFGKIVQSGIFFQNFSVLPILFFLTRKQFISLVNKPHLENRLFYFFTAFFLVVTTLVGVLDIDVSIILSFDGAVVGFFMGYGIPIFIHLKCLFHKYTSNQNKQRVKNIGQSSTDMSLMTEEQQYDQQLTNQLLKCNQHPPHNKNKTYAIYGLVMAVGVALGIFKIYSFFT